MREFLVLIADEDSGWDPATAVAYDGVVPIEAIQIAVPGAMAAAKTFDFCLTDVEPG